MRLRRDKDSEWGLNMTATADISFMLLVFFLITTSMSVDKGLARQLPPINNESLELEVEREDVLSITLDAEGAGLVESQTIRDFIIEHGDKHVILLECDEACPYSAYYKAQNAISEGYAQARAVVKTPLRLCEK